MKLASQAWRFLIPLAALGSAGLWLMGRPSTVALGMALAILSWGFFAFCAYFFRDPDRPAPPHKEKIYSPGDGVVLSVAREGPGDVVTLRIFLSVFDVHVQRAPCAGRVAKVSVVPGSFAAAMRDEARANSRVVMTVEPDGRPGSPLVVEQIAGLVARRIECWPKEGERVEAGQRYGIIYFGSQAAVHFPAGSRCLVQPGARVVGGLTEIGEWTSSS